jgi:hypothetical protein
VPKEILHPKPIRRVLPVTAGNAFAAFYDSSESGPSPSIGTLEKDLSKKHPKLSVNGQIVVSNPSMVSAGERVILLTTTKVQLASKLNSR